MKTYSPDEVKRAYDAAPSAVREEVDSGVDAAETITDLGQQYGLHVDVMGTLAVATTYMLLGLMSPAELIGELELAGLDANTARAVIEALNQKIFIPLQQKLREGSTPAAAPMSPAPVAPRPVQQVVPAQPALVPMAVAAAPKPMPVMPPPPRTGVAPVGLPGASAPETSSLPVMPVFAAPARPTPPAPPVAPTPAPTAPIYSAPPIAQAVPQQVAPPRPSPAPAMAIPPRPVVQGPAAPSVMWQTPVPPAWAPPVMTTPAMPVSAPLRAMEPSRFLIPQEEVAEKPVARTMERDVQELANRAQNPGFAPAQAPAYVPPPMPMAERAPAYGRPAPQPAYVPPQTPRAFMPQPAETVPTYRPAERPYVPPPMPVQPAVPRNVGGDPYREPVE